MARRAKSACNLLSSTFKLLSFKFRGTQRTLSVKHQKSMLTLLEGNYFHDVWGSREVDCLSLTLKFSAGHGAPQPNHSFLPSLLSRDRSQASQWPSLALRKISWCVAEIARSALWIQLWLLHRVSAATAMPLFWSPASSQTPKWRNTAVFKSQQRRPVFKMMPVPSTKI